MLIYSKNKFNSLKSGDEREITNSKYINFMEKNLRQTQWALQNDERVTSLIRV